MLGNIFFHGIHDHLTQHSFHFLWFLQTAQHSNTKRQCQITFTYQILQQNALSGVKLRDLRHICQMNLDQALLRIRLTCHGRHSKCQLLPISVGG